MNEQLEIIEKMLRAQLRSAGHVWWIGGFVYGVTSTADPFIILYPATDKLNEKVVRVYSQDFKKLPPFIQPMDGVDTEANPNKEQARRKGIYHECPPFEIVTYDGKDTQMGKERRFGDVLRISRKGQEPTAQTTVQTAAKPQVEATTSSPPADSTRNGQPTIRPLPGTEEFGLPHFQDMAMGAKTATEFDYATYMVLRDDHYYTEVERIGKIRDLLVSAWSPGERSNRAMFAALKAYRQKRSDVENGGNTPTSAHEAAKREARHQYNLAIKE